MNKLRRTLVLFMVFALLVCMACPSYAATTVTLKTRMGCCVRSGPGTSYGTLDHLSSGKTVKGILGKGQGGAIWLMVTNRKFSGRVGFISAYCLQKTSSVTYRVKITNTCFVRSSPDKNSSVIGIAHKGKKFNATGYTGGWVKIGSGWVYSGNCKRA